MERLDILENAPFSFDICRVFQKSKKSMALYFGTAYNSVYSQRQLLACGKQRRDRPFYALFEMATTRRDRKICRNAVSRT